MVFVLSRDFVTVADRKYIKDAIIIPLILLLDTFYFSVSNLRKLLPVALSLLILLSLVPYARAQNNLTGSQMNMTGSQMNMTGSQNECWVVYFWHLSFSISNLMVLNLLEES
ncbi:MAG: hypothetical protein WAM14_00375 [Candidatus Nitrosopolaris sp.]